MNNKARLAIVVVLGVMLFATLSLAAGHGPRKPKLTKCPWPPCADTCDPEAPALIDCVNKKTGESFITSIACCCCNEDAKHRGYRGLR